ncbi:MAG: hypothetical protein ABJC19_03040 [Gemmatimonadota bacterium]
MSEQDRRNQMGAALEEVLIAQRTSEGELRAYRAAEEARGTRVRYQPGLVVFIVVAWGLIAAAWIARPSFIFGVSASRAISAEQREAKMRYAIYLQGARIERFRHESGRLPESLRELGTGVERGVEFERTDVVHYQLVGTVDGRVLRLSDQMSADSFLGDAIRSLPPAQ